MMAREITQGRIERYVRRAITIYGEENYFEWEGTKDPRVGRREMLQELVQFMRPFRWRDYRLHRPRGS